MNEYTCVICKEKFEGYGKDAEPLAEGFCCDECNLKVMAEKLKRASEHKNQTKL